MHTGNKQQHGFLFITGVDSTNCYRTMVPETALGQRMGAKHHMEIRDFVLKT